MAQISAGRVPLSAKVLRIGTRASRLALAQTGLIRQALEAAHPGLRCALVTISAEADEQPELPLTAIGGEGVFVKELAAALLRGAIDAAVHSLKDLPLAMPEGLVLAAIPPRESPQDALVSASGRTLSRLPIGAVVGTSSLRRQGQVLHARPDVVVKPIRGNVDTRLRKLDEGQYDAIVVAAAGLIRLGLAGRITERIDAHVMLPEPGQGALALQTRADDTATRALVEVLDDAATRASVTAERAFLRGLGGGCHLPIAALGRIEGDQLILDGAVVSPDGSKMIHEQGKGSVGNPDALGESLAKQAITTGAKELLQK